MIIYSDCKDIDEAVGWAAKIPGAKYGSIEVPAEPVVAEIATEGKEEHMETNKAGFSSVDEYIASFPEAIQKILEELRTIIKAAAPGSEEKISYQMPSYALKGNLVHFAAWKNHIGFYGASSAIPAFKDELSIYAGEKGTLKFPIDEPIPLELISKIVKFRVAENLK